MFYATYRTIVSCGHPDNTYLGTVLRHRDMVVKAKQDCLEITTNCDEHEHFMREFLMSNGVVVMRITEHEEASNPIAIPVGCS